MPNLKISQCKPHGRQRITSQRNEQIEDAVKISFEHRTGAKKKKFQHSFGCTSKNRLKINNKTK